MSEIHPLPTEPTTDLMSYMVPLSVSTSNSAYAGFHSRVTTPSGHPEFNFEKFAADHELRQLLYKASANQASPRTEYDWIENLGEAGYHLLQPIPVETRRVEPGDFLASFRQANIAISGSDNDDAFQALVVEILETFDALLGERNLGPDAAEQLRILGTYIVRT